MIKDTIVAIATAVANNAIAIIKVSGADSLAIVNSCFKGPNLQLVKSHTIHYGYIYDHDQIIDEVLVSVFLSPKTFTKENVVEINCHGGIYVTNRILELLLIKGARLAEPGEFTKRAFLSGRIDLTKAEAVMDIIESKTASSLKMANFGLLGETRKVISDFQNQLMEIILKIEVNIDYPEYEDEEQITINYLQPHLIKLLTKIDSVLEKAQISKILKYGISTAIVGKPNVGKSSLLNALLREQKAIVTEIAGTTRDLIEGSVNIGGVVLNLIDTAGIRQTSDFVEKIGVEKAKEMIEKAELILLVLDNSLKLSDLDYQLLELTKNKNRLIIINKKDLPSEIKKIPLEDCLLISSFNQDDISYLENKIKQKLLLDKVENIDPTYIGNARQLAKLKQAKNHLQDALSSLEQNMPIDIAHVDIRQAWLRLGEILGRVDSEDLIDEMFARFCLGK